MQPLPKTHPEFEVINRLPLLVEYRVHNYKLRKDGTSRLRFGYGYSYLDVVSVLLLYFLWSYFHASLYCLILTHD